MMNTYEWKYKRITKRLKAILDKQDILYINDEITPDMIGDILKEAEEDCKQSRHDYQETMEQTYLCDGTVYRCTKCNAKAIDYKNGFDTCFENIEYAPCGGDI